MSQKKVIGRNVAIALGIICIIFVAATVAAVAQYTSIIDERDKTIAAKDTEYQNYVSTHSHSNTEYDDYVSSHSRSNTEYGSLQSQYDEYVAMHQHTDTQYDSLQSSYSSLQSQFGDYVASHSFNNSEYNELIQIVGLNKSTVWVDSQTISQTKGSASSWNFPAEYAGLVTVKLESSTTEFVFAEVSFDYNSRPYSEEYYISSAGGTAPFPVLPATWGVQISVGNYNTDAGATETVTITYWY